MSFGKSKRVTARKAHSCASCNCKISKGKRHQHIKGYCGEIQAFYDYRMCSICKNAIKRLYDYLCWDEVSPETLIEDWKRIAIESPRDKKAQLISRTLQRLKNRS